MIHTYVAEATVMAGETTTVPFACLKRSGSLRVRVDDQRRVRVGQLRGCHGLRRLASTRGLSTRGLQHACGAYQCRAGTYTFELPGRPGARLGPALQHEQQPSRRRWARRSPGATTTPELNFDAPVRVDP